MRRAAAILLLVCGVAGAVGSSPGLTAAPHVGGRPPQAVGSGGPPRPIRLTRPGANLVHNPGAQTGAASIGGWDAVTIPGWRVLRGLPTVVRAGTRGFPPASAAGGRGDQLFAGGAGGSAALAQWIPLGVEYPPATDVRYRLSALLGASSTSRASVVLRFLSDRGRVLAVRRQTPVRGRDRHAARRLRSRTLTGRLPIGAVRAELIVQLVTSLRNIDGAYAPRVGYDRAVADDVRFTVDRPERRRPALRPPSSRVPHYRHVFLFYFENQDVDEIVGDRRRAPYYNRLISQGSSLNRMFAEEHPSDGNYLALAGGSVFGVPLDDPAEENSQYTIHAADIGDRVGGYPDAVAVTR